MKPDEGQTCISCQRDPATAWLSGVPVCDRCRRERMLEDGAAVIREERERGRGSGFDPAGFVDSFGRRWRPKASGGWEFEQHPHRGDWIEGADDPRPDPSPEAKATMFEDRSSDVADAPAPDLAVIRAAAVKVEKVTWLWPGRIPLGKLTVLDGDPGLGKSTITLDLAARVSTASPLPDGYRPDRKAGVLLLSAEDGVADTIVPRLKAAGADLKLVNIVDHVTDDAGPRPPELPGDLDRLQAHLSSLLFGEACYTPGLVVVDPLMAFLGGEVNANRDQDVRRVLFRLKLMAEATGCAVVVVRHLNKAPGTNPLYRGGGSIGIIGAARAGLLVGVDPDDEGRSILAVSKSNLAAKPPSLAYRLASDDLYDTARVVWDGASEHTASDLLGRPLERPAPKLEAAEAFLSDALAEQERPVAWLQKVAKAKGISWDTVKRAKEALEVIVERRGEEGRRGGGAWWWRLPAGQLQIKESTTNTSPHAPLNGEHESAGQRPNSESPAIKGSTSP